MTFREISSNFEPAVQPQGSVLNENTMHTLTLASIAISLKRLADAADRPQPFPKAANEEIWITNPKTGEIKKLK